MLIVMTQLSSQEGLISSADGIERPEGAQLYDEVFLLLKQCAQLLFRAAQIVAGFRAPGQFQPRLSAEPLVRMSMQPHQLCRAELRDITNLASLRLSVTDLVNPAAGSVHAAVFVTFSRVA